MYVIYYYYVYIISNSYNMRPPAMYCPTDAPLANLPLFTPCLVNLSVNVSSSILPNQVPTYQYLPTCRLPASEYWLTVGPANC